MTSSSSGAASAVAQPPTELAVALATRLKSSPASLETASRLLFDELVDEITLGVAFEMHRSAKSRDLVAEPVENQKFGNVLVFSQLIHRHYNTNP